MTVDAAVLAELAPTGVLRAAINYGGNPLLAQRGEGGQPGGVSTALARGVGGGDLVRHLRCRRQGICRAARGSLGPGVSGHRAGA